MSRQGSERVPTVLEVRPVPAGNRRVQKSTTPSSVKTQIILPDTTRIKTSGSRPTSADFGQEPGSVANLVWLLGLVGAILDTRLF